MNHKTDSLNKTKLINSLKRSVSRGKPKPVLTSFNINDERTIEKSSVVLQDEVDKVSVAGLKDSYWVPKDVLRSSVRCTPRVDKYPPMRVQQLLELISDNFETRELVLACKPIEVFMTMGPTKTITHDENHC